MKVVCEKGWEKRFQAVPLPTTCPSSHPSPSTPAGLCYGGFLGCAKPWHCFIVFQSKWSFIICRVCQWLSRKSCVDGRPAGRLACPLEWKYWPVTWYRKGKRQLSLLFEG